MGRRLGSRVSVLTSGARSHYADKRPVWSGRTSRGATACSVDRRRRLLLPAVTRGKGAEGLRVERIVSNARDTTRRPGPERRGPGPVHERRALADDRAGSDLTHLAIVDLDDEHPVEDQVHLGSAVAL